jgi:hypothetical protein
MGRKPTQIFPFYRREKSLFNPGATFYLIKTLNYDRAVPTRLLTFNKHIGKSIIKVKRPKTLYLNINNIIITSFFVFNRIY